MKGHSDMLTYFDIQLLHAEAQGGMMDKAKATGQKATSTFIMNFEARMMPKNVISNINSPMKRKASLMPSEIRVSTETTIFFISPCASANAVLMEVTISSMKSGSSLVFSAIIFWICLLVRVSILAWMESLYCCCFLLQVFKASATKAF